MIALQGSMRYSVPMSHETYGYIPLEAYVETAHTREALSPRQRVDLLYDVMKQLARENNLGAIDEAMSVGSSGSYEHAVAVVAALTGESEAANLTEIIFAQYLETKLYLSNFAVTKQEAYDHGDLEPHDTILGDIYQLIAEHKAADEEFTEADVFAFIATERESAQSMRDQFGDIEQLRQDFIDRFTQLASELGVGDALLERAIFLAKTTNIVLMSPLEIETGNAYTRTAYPDCFAAYNSAIHDVTFNMANILAGCNTARQRDASVRGVLYHELIHSIGTAWTDKTEQGVRRSVYFPEFIEEALAEKLSFRLLPEDQRKVTRRRYRKGDRRQNYPRFRHSYMPPAHTMSGTYDGYRYALDMMMAKLDWAAAGITQEDAEKLLLCAWLDGPSDIASVSRECPHLRAFHQYLTKASFPGFMQHLRDLFDYEGGEQRIMNCFDAEGFDPHDKQFFERSATTKLYDWDTYAEPWEPDNAQPDTATLIRLGRLHFKHQFGWRDFVLHEDEGAIETYDREFSIVKPVTRYLALKALIRQRMDERAAQRSQALNREYHQTSQLK
jgi:hypothetical protein